MAITFDVERFEHVTATPETALLRVSGRWVSDQRERLSPPMLVVDDGRRTHRLPALPGPEDAAPLADPEGPRWRAAFSAPAELITGTRNVFALDAGRGAVAAINAFATGGLTPDRTLLLRIDPALGRARQAGRGEAPDRLEREEDAFFGRIAAAYDGLAAAEPERFRVLDAMRPPDEVLDDALEAIRGLA